MECGINAPNGMNKQSWEVRVVDNPEFINGLTEIFKKENPKAAERPGFQNMFNNAPTVVFFANDPAYDMSQIDCGLLCENMILSAWSMGIGSCCLGGPVRFMKSPAPTNINLNNFICYHIWFATNLGIFKHKKKWFPIGTTFYMLNL